MFPPRTSALKARDVDDILHEILGGPGQDQEIIGDRENVKAMEDRLDEGKVKHEQREGLGQVSKARPLEREYDISPDSRREVYRVYRLRRNLGHPNMETFLRALKHVGIKREREFRCPLCKARRKPDSHRPGHLSRRLDINEIVGIDIFSVAGRTLTCFAGELRCSATGQDHRNGHQGLPQELVRTLWGAVVSPEMLEKLESGHIVIVIIRMWNLKECRPRRRQPRLMAVG